MTTVLPTDIRERTARARRMMARARSERFAVGAFNADNLETVRAICRAAHAMQAPVLIEVSQAETEAMGLGNIRDVVDNEADQLGIEAYLNLDHAPTIDAAVAGIEAEFEFVHLDLLQSDPTASAEQVVAATRHVVGYALLTGALVEGEQHHFAGTSTVHRDPADRDAIASSLSTPLDARRFVDDTGVDTLSVGIGNVHGRYPTPTRLNIQLLGRIRAAVGPHVNLSLHGGSQTPPYAYQASILAGINKVNINSDLRYAYRSTLERELAAHPQEYAATQLLRPVVDAVQHVVESKIEMFGSAHKAAASWREG
jgi:fructose-bisphosphate aldolase class II